MRTTAEFTIETDQPVRGGGDGSAPAPFDLFLASIGTCAGIYALGFMQQRGLDPAAPSHHAHPLRPSGRSYRPDRPRTKTPPGFPDKYRDAIINAMDLCKVKKHLAQPPKFSVTTVAS